MKNTKKNKKATAAKNKTSQNKTLDINDSYKIADLFFKQSRVLYKHHFDSYDKFIDDDIRSLLTNGNNIFFVQLTKDKTYTYKFEYSDISLSPPIISATDEIMYPQDARDNNLTYASNLIATIKQIQEITDINTGKIIRKQVGNPEYRYPIATIPIMVRSKYCSLNFKGNIDKRECIYDPGGYFIINGSEKAVMSIERMAYNKAFVFVKKDQRRKLYRVMVVSKLYGYNKMNQIITIYLKKNKLLTIKVPILNEIPVFILFRALGIESDKDIVNTIVYDENDTEMMNLVRISLENSVTENSKMKIVTREEALLYLLNKMRLLKRYSETDPKDKKLQKKMDLEEQLQTKFLPHIDNDVFHKAYYLGYMINRLLNCFLGRIDPDERDSYLNKRVDTPGELLFELFRQHYKKMLNSCRKFFGKRNNDNENPRPIINQIKPSIIESGLNNALLSGNWGNRKGVAQVLQRLSYPKTIATLRRVNAPTVDASTNKLIKK